MYGYHGCRQVERKCVTMVTETVVKQLVQWSVTTTSPYPQFVPVVKQMVPESISSYHHKIGDVITNFAFPSCSSCDENILVSLMMAVVDHNRW